VTDGRPPCPPIPREDGSFRAVSRIPRGFPETETRRKPFRGPHRTAGVDPISQL